MLILPIRTPLLKYGDNLGAVIRASCDLQSGDIVVFSSKAIATVEGAAIKLAELLLSPDAERWSSETGRSAAFCEAVLQETKRLNGRVVGHAHGALLTELRPDGLKKGVILAPNAGLDESNIEQGFAIGWPVDPMQSMRRLQQELPGDCALIIGDSCTIPRRLGVMAFALAVSGIDPFKNEIGNTDLFSNTMKITVESVADQLATAANAVMGNAAQSCPAAVIRNHGIAPSTFEGWVDGIDPKEDLFKDML